MPRTGVSYDEVAACIDSLVAEGESPTIRKVREALDKGSDTTIHKHVVAWREKHDPLSTATSELPGYLLGVLKQFEERLRADERAKYEVRLVTTQSDANELALKLEEAEESLAARELEMGTLLADKTALLAKTAEQTTEIVQIKGDLDRAHNATELARSESAKTSSMLVVREEKISELVLANDKLRAELDAAQQALIASEKGLAVANAKLDAAIEKSQLLLQDKERLSGQLGAALDSATAARVEIAKVVGGREQQTMTMDSMPVFSEGERQPDVLEVAEQAVQQPQTTANDNIEG